MALPDKHQLKFNSHKDAKTLMEAIEKRFGRNTETKKVQKTILKQQFENFTGSSSEGLDQIHDRLQNLSSSEWKTHTLIWKNKADLKEQNLDDLFNSLKIYETEVKQSSSSSTATQNLAFMSSTSTDSTTDSVSAAASISATCVKFTTDSVSAAASISATYVKLSVSSLPNIDVDDLEEMDLKWQMAMFIMRARWFLQKTGRNLGANETSSMGFDMSKVECYNCHRKGHFARECRSFKDQRRPGTTEPQRRTVSVETSTSNVLVSQCDGTGSYDWSYQAEEEPANFALMDFSLSLSSNNETDLESVEARLLVFTKAMFDCDTYYSLESDCEPWPPSNLYDRFQPSGGYHVVPPIYTRTFMPPEPDLVFNTAHIPVETDYLAFNVQLSPTKIEQDFSHTSRPSAPTIKDWVSDSEVESEPKDPQQSIPSFAQSSEHVKTPRHSVQPIKTTFQAAPSVLASPTFNSSCKRRNRKACFVCKSVDHLIKDCDFHAKKMAKPTQRNYAHRGYHKQYVSLPHAKHQKHRVHPAVLTQSKSVSNTAVRPVSAALPNISVTRPKHVSTASTTVPTVGQNFLNSTNTFSATGLSNTAVSLIYGDASQFPDDPDMRGLKDIIYSDDEDVVGAEADFNNLESSIPEEPKREHQALKDPSWIEAMQKELLQFKMQKVWVLVDLPYGKRAIGKSASTPIDTKKPLLKDHDVCACVHFQVTPKALHLHTVKRIFRYLKGKPYLGLWYPNDSPFDLVAYSDSDYAGASLDRKSTTGGCQFLGCRLISWQCKKQTVVATSSTKAEYVAAASCCAQVLWIQNQLLDYGYNFMHTIIYIDNSSTICIIKNPVLHSKTKHKEIRHHFIRDCNEKKLIQVMKIPTENNFADLLTKAFDVGRFQNLVASIGLLNL
nr:putative ribonuclease H-like domain-containing protein [Tanacetum cinerariifolium]